MGKMNFIYLGKDWYGNPIENLPKEINAIKMDGTFLPFEVGENETVETIKERFFYGYGWLKMKKQKKYVIPAFDGNIENFKEYYEKYGKEVLMFSMSGRVLNKYDYCDAKYYYEISCINAFGCEKYDVYASTYNHMKQLIVAHFNSEYMKIFKAHSYGENIIERFTPKPELVSYLIPLMTMDVLSDDNMLSDLYYGHLHKWELIEKHNLYNEYQDACSKIDKYKEGKDFGVIRYDNTYEDLLQKKDDIYRLILEDVRNQIKHEKELEYGTDEFPQQFSGRLKILFGEEVEKLYSTLISVSLDDEK